MGASDQSGLQGPNGLHDPEVWQRTSRSLRLLACSIVRDEALAEDLVQGAWLRSLQPGGRSKGLGWLRLWVKSRAVDQRRRRPHADLASLDERAAPQDPESSGDGVAERLEQQQAVLAAVDALDEPYRTTVYLRYFDGLGPIQIGERLGVPLKTVKSRLTRAHGRLRENLQRRVGDGRGSWTPAFLAYAGPSGSLVGMAGASWSPLSLLTLTAMKNIALGLALILVTLLVWRVSWTEPLPPSLDGHAPPAAGPELVGQARVQPADQDSAGKAHGRIAASEVDEPAQGPVEFGVVPSGAVRVRVDWANGDPALGVHVVLFQAWGNGSSWRSFRRGTGQGGVAEFPQMPPGEFQVRTSHSGGWVLGVVEVLVGQTSELDIELPGGRQVVGRVVDGGGAPVAGAGIWLSTGYSDWTGGGIVALSDGGGAFALRDVEAGSSIGALADGYEPSALLDLDLVPNNAPGGQEPASVELVLLTGGATLRGIVRTAEGEPLAAALVAVGEPRRQSGQRMDGSLAEAWSPRTALTGVDGRFVLYGLESGDVTMRVRSFGWSQWNARLALARSEVHEVKVTLDKGATVTGTVTGPHGQPVAGAAVHAFDRPLSESYLQNGQIDTPSILAHEVATAGEDGTYRLERVAARQMYLYALCPKPDESIGGKPLGFARKQVQLVPGEVYGWSPQIVDGPTIHGTARYADGTPITDVFISVKCTDSDARDRRALRTSDGSFRFIQLPGEAYDVRVQMRGQPEGAEEPRALGVRPGDGPIELVADWPAPGGAVDRVVRLRFEDPSERVRDPGRLTLWIEQVGVGSAWEGHCAGAVWTFSLQETGRFRPVAAVGDRVIAIGDEFELDPTDPVSSVDLGALVAGPGAALVLHLERQPGGVTAGVRAFLRHAECRIGETVPLGPDEVNRIDNLEPGSGELRLNEGPELRRSLPYELVAGQETHLNVALTPAVPVPYTIVWDTAHPPESLTIRFRSRDDGSLVESLEVPIGTARPSPIQWTQFLAPGRYTFEVLDAGGTLERQYFEVSPGPYTGVALHAKQQS